MTLTNKHKESLQIVSNSLEAIIKELSVLKLILDDTDLKEDKIAESLSKCLTEGTYNHLDTFNKQ